MNGIYKETAAVLFELDKRSASFRALVFGSKHQNKKLLYKICYETMSRRRGLAEMLNELPELAQDDVFSASNAPFIQYVLLYEYLFGRGLKKCHKSWRDAVEKHGAELRALKDRIFSSNADAKERASTVSRAKGGGVSLPRYARINTLKITLRQAIEHFCDAGWTLVPEEGVLSEKYCELVDALPKRHFFSDVHVPDLLVFPSGTDLHDEPLVVDGSVVLQDKSSCLSILCLDPQPKTYVMDLCAAPGLKTSLIASAMHNEGTIFAFDKNFDRFQLTKQLLAKYGVQCAVVRCQDMLRVNLSDKAYKNVSHVLLDPPCSGSGMAKRQEFFTCAEKGGKDEGRLRKLSNLQCTMLRHALTLPNLRRLVYSTCSVFDEENEEVVEEVVRGGESKFGLVHALPEWRHRGHEKYSVGAKCLRASPEQERTNGFFVAVFEPNFS